MEGIKNRSEQRNIYFQKSFNEEKIRKIREEKTISLRKRKRNLHVSNKRMALSAASVGGKDILAFEVSWVPNELAEAYPELINSSLAPAQRISLLTRYISAEDTPDRVFHLTKCLREILAKGEVLPLNFITNSGIIKKIISLTASSRDLQTEAYWCLINISTGPKHIIEEIIQQGVVSAIKNTLKLNDLEVTDLAVWCVGNLAREGSFKTDFLDLTEDLVSLLAKLDCGKWKNTLWALSSICNGKNMSEKSRSLVLSHMGKVLKLTDEEVLSYGCLLLSYLADGNHECIQEIIDAGLVPQLRQLLDEESQEILVPVLRTFGGIAAGNEMQTQLVIDIGVADKVGEMLGKNCNLLRKEALWVLSNLAAGNDEQVEFVLSHPSFKLVVQGLKDPAFEIKNESLWTVCNATYAKSFKVRLRILELGAFEGLCDILELKNSTALKVALSGIDNLLEAGESESENRVALRFEETGGLDKLEKLQRHPNSQIYEKAVEIIAKYYGLIDPCEDGETEKYQFK